MEQQFAKVQDRALDNPLAEQLSYSFTDVLSRTRNQMREFVRVILVLRAEVQKLTNENEETRHALSVGKLLLEKDMNRGLDCCPFCAEKTRVGGVGHENGCSLRPDIYCSREDCPLCEQDADEQDADEQDPSS
jgi:hypothetical protein